MHCFKCIGRKWLAVGASQSLIEASTQVAIPCDGTVKGNSVALHLSATSSAGWTSSKIVEFESQPCSVGIDDQHITIIDISAKVRDTVVDQWVVI